MFYFVFPLILFPAAVGGIVVADWLRRRDWLLLGSFLVGAGGLWAVMSGWALVNDMADAAVSTPGWTPIPLALGAAATRLLELRYYWRVARTPPDHQRPSAWRALRTLAHP